MMSKYYIWITANVLTSAAGVDLHDSQTLQQMANNFANIGSKLDSAFESALKQVSKSKLKYDVHSPLMRADTFSKLSNLPPQAQKLALFETLRMMVNENRHTSYMQQMKEKKKQQMIQKQMKANMTASTKESNLCHMTELSQIHHMTEGNVYSSVDVPWLRLILADTLEFLPEYDSSADDLVRKALGAFGFTSTTDKLSDCGWSLLSAGCVHEKRILGGAGFKTEKCSAERLTRDPLGYSRDKVMFLRNTYGGPKGEDDFFPPGTCAFISHYMNDVVEHMKYREWDMDIKRWEKKNVGNGPDKSNWTKLTYDEAHSWKRWTSETSGKSHVVWSLPLAEYDVIKQTEPFKQLKQMMDNPASTFCTKFLFAGFSLGGLVSELLKLEFSPADSSGVYSDKCKNGTPCVSISMSATGMFPDNEDAPKVNSDTSCQQGYPAENMKDASFFLEGDIEPIRLNALKFGYDIWPKKANSWNIIPGKSERDIMRAWPDEPNGYTTIKGMALIEMRRDLIVKDKADEDDGIPFVDTCVQAKVVPCGMTLWSYYSSEDYKDRLDKIRKPLGSITPDGTFYWCRSAGSNRFCGHTPHAFEYWESIKFGRNQTCADADQYPIRIPMPEGSTLLPWWRMILLAKGMLTGDTSNVWEQ